MSVISVKYEGKGKNELPFKTFSYELSNFLLDDDDVYDRLVGDMESVEREDVFTEKPGDNKDSGYFGFAITAEGFDPKGCFDRFAKTLNDYSFKFSLQALPVDNKYQVVVTLNAPPVVEALKFTTSGNAKMAACKVPNDQKADFLTDVASKFGLKKSSKYGGELYSTTASEKAAKYYLTKTVDGKIYAFINTKYDPAFHTDVNSFKEYIEKKIEEYTPKPAEETTIPEAPEERANPFKQNFFESKFIEENEDNVVGIEIMRELIGGKALWEVLVEGKDINFADGLDGFRYKIKTLNENKFIIESKPVEEEEEEIPIGGDEKDEKEEGDGKPEGEVEAIINANIEPGDEVELQDGAAASPMTIIYFIRMKNGDSVIVTPDYNQVDLIVSGVSSVATAENLFECKLSDIAKFRKKKVLEKKDKGPTQTNYLKSKGFVTGGNNSTDKGTAYDWEKHNTTLENYSLIINKEDKTYRYEYNVVNLPDLTKKSKEFSYEALDDIIFPSTMDEFDHIMSLKTDDLYKKGTKVSCKVDGKEEEGKIKKFNFGTYLVKIGSQEKEIKANQIKPINEYEGQEYDIVATEISVKIYSSLERDITAEQESDIQDVAKLFHTELQPRTNDKEPPKILYIETLPIVDLVEFNKELKKIDKFLEADPVTLPGVDHNIAPEVNKANKKLPTT